jgi:uncharacterized damage-inducible protein DinB
MISREYCVTLALYNAWMNDKVFALCADLPDAVRRQDLGAFFGSIHRTLNHVLAVDQMLLEHWRSGTPTYLPDSNGHESFEALRTARAEQDSRITAWARSVSSEWLSERTPFHRELEGGAGTVSRGFWVTHGFNHQTHHRGQITTLLSQLGHDIGSTDLHAMAPNPAVIGA